MNQTLKDLGFTDTDIAQWYGKAIIIEIPDGAPARDVYADADLLQQSGVKTQISNSAYPCTTATKSEMRSADAVYVAAGQPVSVYGTKQRSLPVPKAHGLPPNSYGSDQAYAAVMAGVSAAELGVLRVAVFDASQPHGLLNALKGKKSTKIYQPIAMRVSG